MARRTGFTIIETMLAVVIVSIMTLIAFPKVRSSMIKADLRGARTRVVNMLSAARITATQGNRSAWLTFNGNTAVVTASPRRNLPIGANTLDTIGTTINLNTVYGAAVSLSGGVTRVAYDPRGIASGFGGTVTISLARSGYTQSIVVDMLGRVTK
jgi:prepilin-type N-terminal cleavage/methylation domain-containing protein